MKNGRLPRRLIFLYLLGLPPFPELEVVQALADILW